MGEKLGGETAITSVLNQPKGYPMLYDMVSNES